MAEYYVDPTATGADSGASQTDAWTSLQRAIDGTGGTQPVAGDTVLLKANGSTADETLTVKIDADGAAGSTAAGLIKYIGVNSSWVNDGTRYLVDGNNAAVNCLDTVATTDYVWWENIRFTKATGTGVNFNLSGSYRNAFINCCFDNNGAHGIYAYRNSGGVYFRCVAYGNSSDGFGTVTGNLLFSSSHDNGVDGFSANFGIGVIYGCLAYDNTNDGFNEVAAGMPMIQCTSNGNGNDGVLVKADWLTMIGNRITNHTDVGDKGVDCSLEMLLHAYNYFENNDGANYQNILFNYELLHDGSGTDVEDQANTNQGYTSIVNGSEDFNLRSDASLRRTAITIPII